MEKKLYSLESKILHHLLHGIENPSDDYKYDALLQKYFYKPENKNKHAIILYKIRKQYVNTSDKNKKIDLLQDLIIIHKNLKNDNPKKYKYVKNHKNTNYDYIVKKYFSLSKFHFGENDKSNEIIDLVSSDEVNDDELYTNLNRVSMRRPNNRVIEDDSNTNVMQPPTTTNLKRQLSEEINETNKRQRFFNNSNNNLNNSNNNLNNSNNNLNNSNSNVINFTSRHESEILQYSTDPSSLNYFKIRVDDFRNDCDLIYRVSPVKYVYRHKITQHIYKCILISQMQANGMFTAGDKKGNINGEVLIHKVLYEIMSNYNGSEKICKIPQVFSTFSYVIDSKLYAVIEMEDAGEAYGSIVSEFVNPTRNICQILIRILNTFKYINRYVTFIHCDFKLNNFCFKNNTKEYFIIDFGFSYMKYNSNVIWMSRHVYDNKQLYPHDIIFFMYHILGKVHCDRLPIDNQLETYLTEVITKSKYSINNMDCNKRNNKLTYQKFYIEENLEIDGFIQFNLVNDLLKLINNQI